MWQVTLFNEVVLLFWSLPDPRPYGNDCSSSEFMLPQDDIIHKTRSAKLLSVPQAGDYSEGVALFWIGYLSLLCCTIWAKQSQVSSRLEQQIIYVAFISFFFFFKYWMFKIKIFFVVHFVWFQTRIDHIKHVLFSFWINACCLMLEHHSLYKPVKWLTAK